MNSFACQTLLVVLPGEKKNHFWPETKQFQIKAIWQVIRNFMKRQKVKSRLKFSIKYNWYYGTL